MKDAEEDYAGEGGWTPSDEDIQSAIDFFDEAVPEAAGLLNAETVEYGDDEIEHDPEIVQARVEHYAITLSAGYRPDLFMALLEQVGNYRAFERELEAQNSPTSLELLARDRAFGCDRHSTIKLDGYSIAIGDKQSFDAYDVVGIGETLRVYPDMNPTYKRADRAEKYFRTHLAGKLINALHQLLIESVYAASGESVPASKARAIEKITTMIDKCPGLQSRKAGRPMGSSKPAEERERQRQEFERQVEATIRRLLANSGMMPTKTKVAQELNIGGRSPRTGNDTSLNAFNAKLERLGVDYDEIVRRIKPHE